MSIVITPEFVFNSPGKNSRVCTCKRLKRSRGVRFRPYIRLLLKNAGNGTRCSPRKQWRRLRGRQTRPGGRTFKNRLTTNTPRLVADVLLRTCAVQVLNAVPVLVVTTVTAFCEPSRNLVETAQRRPHSADTTTTFRTLHLRTRTLSFLRLFFSPSIVGICYGVSF